MKNPNTFKGFTLLELLVVLGMMAILVTLAAPSFIGSIKRNGVLSEQRELKLDVAYARSEAVSRGSSVGICASSDGASCNDNDNWSAGWLVFLDNGNGDDGVASDGRLNGGEELLRVYRYYGQNTISLQDALSVGARGISFSPRGYLESVKRDGEDLDPERLSFLVCEPDNEPIYARGVLIDLTGRGLDSFDNNSNGIHEDISGADFICS